MKCIIVDDEKPARALLENYIQQLGQIELVASCKNALEARDILQRKQIDLMVLDIQMPDLTGIDLLKILDNRPLTIITSAYKQHALDGYELDVIDYIVKPVSLERFHKAISKAKEFLQFKYAPAGMIKDFIFIKDANRLIKVVFDDILYIEGYREYLKVHLQNEKTLMPLMSFLEIEKLLTNPQFFRVHKSYLVNLKHILNIESRVITIEGGISLTISDTYKNAFFEHLKKFGWI